LRQLAEAVQESKNLRLQPGTLQLVFETHHFVARGLGLKFGESIRIMLAGVIQAHLVNWDRYALTAPGR
jgi:hypothetical protein